MIPIWLVFILDSITGQNHLVAICNTPERANLYRRAIQYRIDGPEEYPHDCYDDAIRVWVEKDD